MGTGSCSILFTNYSWVEGRKGTQAALLSLYQKHSITVTVHSYSLQLDTPICSDPSVPGTESGPDPGADALASSDMRQAEHWAADAAGGRVKKFCLHLIHWRLTSGIW